MTQIVGFAGKKQSGKNTCCNYIYALKIAELGISKKSRLTDSGTIEVTDIFGETVDGKEWFELSNKNLNFEKLKADLLDQYIKIYGFADILKDLCIDILGLTYEQTYGTDNDKNSDTSVMRPDSSETMTAREVLQYVGTDIFRKLDPHVWIKSLLRKIDKDSPEVALICDVRFTNEVLKLQEIGGFVVGLTRDPCEDNDSHSSEQETSESLKKCDIVIDNSEMSLQQQLSSLHSSIKHLPKVLPRMEK